MMCKKTKFTDIYFSRESLECEVIPIILALSWFTQEGQEFKDNLDYIVRLSEKESLKKQINK